MTGDPRYRDFTAKQRDWLLGRNPWGYTMFTEIGSVFPKDTHMTTFKLTGRTARGGLVDGPVYERIFKSLKGVSITEPDPLGRVPGRIGRLSRRLARITRPTSRRWTARRRPF